MNLGGNRSLVRAAAAEVSYRTCLLPSCYHMLGCQVTSLQYFGLTNQSIVPILSLDMRHPEPDQPQDLLARIHFACRTRQVVDPESGGSLSAHQASILDHLDEDNATTLSQLASHMGVTLSTMSLAIRRLVAEGFVRRRRDEDDGRKVCLRLTPAGARIKKAKSTLDPERVANMIDALSAEERGAALRGLALLSQAAQSMPRQTHRVSRAEQADPAGLPQKERDP